MLIEELKCLEILLRHLITKNSLETEILTEFSDEDTFKEYKNNLFNLISIDSLLANYPQTFSFSLESFLKTGIIPNMFEEKTTTPIIDSDFKGDYHDFYTCMIKALENNDYVFDHDNNIHLSTSTIEATVPQVWLYRLQAAAKRGTYERIFFYNKTNLSNIPNTKSLIEYLRHTKSFITKVTTSNPNADYELDFLTARNLIKSKLSNQKEVKVDNIIKLFVESMPQTYEVEIGKYKISNEFWLVKKADSLGKAFYKEPIEVQERLLNKWILERVMSRELAFKETQKYILISNPGNEYNFASQPIKEESVITGLFNLYINLISQLKLDTSNLNLSYFKVKKNITEPEQANIIEYSKYSRIIAEINTKKEMVSKKARELLQKINQLDIIKDFELISQLRQDYEHVLTSYEQCEAEKQKYINNLHNLDQNQGKQQSTEESSLFEQILEATKKGRLYLSGNNLVIELSNNYFGEPIFLATINTEQLLEWIEDINYSFEEPNKKVG